MEFSASLPDKEADPTNIAISRDRRRRAPSETFACAAPLRPWSRPDQIFSSWCLTLRNCSARVHVMSKTYRQFVRQIQVVRNIRAGRSRMADEGFRD